MMKRGAETQLTRDNAENEEVEEVSSLGGAFAKASQSALAGRVIKPLPNRSQTKQPPAAASSFGGFGTSNSPKVEFGTGLKGSGVSEFTFSAPSALSVPSSSQPSRSAFSFTTQSAATLQSSAATGASKKLTSILSSTPSSESVSMDLNEIDPETPEQNYYVSLRALNAAFFSSVEIYYRRDKFMDMGIFFERYKAERANIEQTLAEGRNLMDPLPPPSMLPPANGTTSTSSSFGQTTPKPLAPPAAPAAFVFGSSTSKTMTPSSNSAAPAFGSGFAPKPATSAPTTTPFSFPSTSSATPSASLFNNPAVFPKESVFASSTTAPKESPYASSTSKESLFGSTSSSPFGSSTTSRPSAFYPAGINTDMPPMSNKPPSTTSAAQPGVFGSSTSLGAASSSPFATPKTSPFTFGSSKPTSGSIGNPVGFTFGGQVPTSASSTDVNKPAATSSPFASPGSTVNAFGSSSTASSGFAFATSSSSTATASPFGSFTKPKTVESGAATPSEDNADDTPASTDGGEAATDDASKPKSLGQNPHDLEGEGEEDEDTLHTIRVKIFRFADQGPGEKGKWVEVGIGMLRLKKNRSDETYRLLSRNTANGKLMMNFRLFNGFNTKREKQMMGFTGHDEGKQVMYKLRTRTEGDMVAFQEELNKIISSLS